MMWSEKARLQKLHTVYSHLHDVLEEAKPHGRKQPISVCRGLGVGVG